MAGVLAKLPPTPAEARYARLRGEAIPVPPWRRIAMVAMIAAIVHDQIHTWVDGDTVASFLAARHSAIGPVVSSPGAWLLIQVMVFVYARAQVGEIQRENPAYDRATKLLVWASALSILRLLTLSVQDVALTAILSLAITAAIAVVLIRLRREVLARRAPALIALPFSLLLGWSLLTAVAALTAAIAAAGGPAAAAAVTLILVTASVVTYLALELHDFVLPGLVGWLLTACAVRAGAPVSSAALLAGALCAIAAILVAGTRFATPKQTAR